MLLLIGLQASLLKQAHKFEFQPRKFWLASKPKALLVCRPFVLLVFYKKNPKTQQKMA